MISQHMLPEAMESIAELQEHDHGHHDDDDEDKLGHTVEEGDPYPLAFLFAGVGYLVILACEVCENGYNILLFIICWI